MRVALISDLHGNLLALDAVLAELTDERLDTLVCLGDVAVGPDPVETLRRVRELECQVVVGNWDSWFLEGMPARDDPIGRKLMELGDWWASRLSDEDRAFMATFRTSVELPLANGTRLRCFHGSPQSFDDQIFATTPEDELERMLGDIGSDLIAVGHTHLPLLRRHRDGLVVNPGSVGMAFHPSPQTALRVAPWAEYAILDADRGRLAVDLRRTAFDVEAFLRIGLESGMPHAKWWAGPWAA